MNYHVIIQRSAEADIEKACEWIANRSPSGAANWYNRLDAAIKSLSDFPERFMDTGESDINCEVVSFAYTF